VVHEVLKIMNAMHASTFFKFLLGFALLING
jgi:hypothetical protein